jgi:hypothetical protein
MKIAVLAWGSLVWDRRKLAIADDFRPHGPHLPIEFCRISGGGRLTLVIDEALGASCATYAAQSSFADLNGALENLWVREGSAGEPLPRDPQNQGRVGFVDVSLGQHSERAMERHPKAVAAITAWAKANGYDAAIWTALASNFHEPEKAGVPFSAKAVIRYLETLDAPKIDAALSYIHGAPPEVQTPIRAAVNARWPEG